MIVEAIFSLVRLVIEAIGALVPDWTPLDISTPLDTVLDAGDPYMGLLAWLNLYVPLEEGLAMAGVLIVVWLAAHAYGGVVWLLSKLHIAGGGST